MTDAAKHWATQLPAHIEVEPYLVKFAVRWARIYDADPLDALQELAVWALEGKGQLLTLKSRIGAQGVGRMTAYGAVGTEWTVSIDKPYKGSHDPLADALASTPAQTDTTIGVVKRALGFWWRSRLITDKQAHVLYLHYVEDAPLSQIGPRYGLSESAAKMHHKHALERLRKEYASGKRDADAGIV